MTQRIPTGKTYHLKTIDDIFSQLTAEQIEVCLVEMARALVMAKSLDALFMATAKELTPGLELPSRALALDEGFSWIDDGKTDLDLTFTDDGAEQFSFSVRKDRDP